MLCPTEFRWPAMLFPIARVGHKLSPPPHRRAHRWCDVATTTTLPNPQRCKWLKVQGQWLWNKECVKGCKTFKIIYKYIITYDIIDIIYNLLNISSLYIHTYQWYQRIHVHPSVNSYSPLERSTSSGFPICFRQWDHLQLCTPTEATLQEAMEGENWNDGGSICANTVSWISSNL